MTIHVLVEGPSEKVLLDAWAPRLLRGEQIKLHPHQGKGRLPDDLHSKPDPKRRGVLDQLPAKLRAFSKSLNPGDSVLVLLDADTDDPVRLRAHVQTAIEEVAGDLAAHVHLAVEECEAFYLGDLKAMQQVFPDADMEKARAYTPDSICGTAELFGVIVGDPGNNKVAWAELMGPVLTTNKAATRSPSFKGLIDTLLRLLPAPSEPQRRKAYRHPTRKKRDSGRRR